MTTKRKKSYLIAIGVGCAALGIDRFMLPERATAPQEAEAAVLAHPIIPAVSSGVTRVPIPAVPFPKNLPPFDPIRGIRDVFVTPSEALVGNDSLLSRQQGPNTAGPKRPSSAAEFVAQHTLSAVLDDPRLKIAVVEGQWIKVGDTLDDCRLTTVSGTAAHFQCPDGEAVLDISDSAVRIRD